MSPKVKGHAVKRANELPGLIIGFHFEGDSVVADRNLARGIGKPLDRRNNPSCDVKPKPSRREDDDHGHQNEEYHIADSNEFGPGFKA